jgi:hypothetical protein
MIRSLTNGVGACTDLTPTPAYVLDATFMLALTVGGGTLGGFRPGDAMKVPAPILALWLSSLSQSSRTVAAVPSERTARWT